MAEATKSERQDGLLWRIARLHPGLLWLLYLAIVLVGSILDGMLQRIDSVLQVPVGVISLLIVLAYPLFVVAFLSNSPTPSSPKRLTRTIGAFVIIGLWGSVLALFSHLTLSGHVDVPLGVQQGLSMSVVPMFAVIFYLWIAGAVALVQAEKGSSYSLWSVFGTFLLFFYLPFFGVFFLQRRIRRLAQTATA